MRRSTRAREKELEKKFIPVPRDYRVTVSYTSSNEDEPPLSIVVKILEQVRGRDFKVMSADSDSEYVRATVSFVFNTTAADEAELARAIYLEYYDVYRLEWDEVNLMDYALIREGVSSKLKTPATIIGGGMDDDMLVGAALGQDGVLNAQYLYDITARYTDGKSARTELLGEREDDNYDPYFVFQVSENSDLVCRMVEHEGTMRWLTVGTKPQVLGLQPFDFRSRMLPVNPIGPPPYLYSTCLQGWGDSERDVQTNLDIFINGTIGVDNVVSRSSVAFKPSFGLMRITYRSEHLPVEEFVRLREAFFRSISEEYLNAFPMRFKRVVT
jgi:hypothetical protein